jgi:hypothetical protein
MSSPPHGGRNVSPPVRQGTLKPLLLPEVTQKAEPTSVLPILLAADRNFVDALIDRYVPERLHEEKGRRLGHGLSLDLSVSRSRPTYAARNQLLEIELPISLDIEVGRKMGPIDLKLGRCHPKLLAKLRVSTRLGPELEVQSPELEIVLKDRCRIAGFDVSPFIEEEIAKQERHAKREMKQRIADARSLVLDQRRVLEDWLAAASPACPRFHPEGLFQSPIVERDGVFSTSVGLLGRMTADCGPKSENVLRLEQRETRPAFELVETRRIDWEALRGALTTALAQLNPTSRLELRSAKTDAGERIAVGITTGQEAGWVFCVPIVAGGALRLVAKESASAPLLAAVSPLLSQVALTANTSELDERSRTLFDQVRRLSQVHVTAPVERRRLLNDAAILDANEEALVDPSGIWIVLRRRERL